MVTVALPELRIKQRYLVHIDWFPLRLEACVNKTLPNEIHVYRIQF